MSLLFWQKFSVTVFGCLVQSYKNSFTLHQIIILLTIKHNKITTAVLKFVIMVLQNILVNDHDILLDLKK